MRPLRIYADTSVIGGCRDPEFSSASERFIEGVREGRFVLLLSEVVLVELEGAPESVQDVLESIPGDRIERVGLTEEVIALRDAYLDMGIVSARHENDATHVAAATVARADAIVSWNFKHIVRLENMKAYNNINLLHGYGLLTIVSPIEVGDHEQESDEGRV